MRPAEWALLLTSNVPHCPEAVKPERKSRSRGEILVPIAAGRSDRWIARENPHRRDEIPDVRHDINVPSELLLLKEGLGAPKKFPN
jgi:hypothetical protein